MFSISGTKTARRSIAIGPVACGLSRADGECYDGVNYTWLADRIRDYDPAIGRFQACILAAGSVLMSNSRVTGLRRARLTKVGGYSYTFDPSSHHWSRSGSLAGPANRLP